jgi:hypothetical protein
MGITFPGDELTVIHKELPRYLTGHGVDEGQGIHDDVVHTQEIPEEIRQDMGSTGVDWSCMPPTLYYVYSVYTMWFFPGNPRGHER